MKIEKSITDKKPLKQRKPKTYFLILLMSFGIIIYALGLKFAPEYMPFQKNPSDDFYAPHSSCFPEPEF